MRKREREKKRKRRRNKRAQERLRGLDRRDKTGESESERSDRHSHFLGSTFWSGQKTDPRSPRGSLPSSSLRLFGDRKTDDSGPLVPLAPWLVELRRQELAQQQPQHQQPDQKRTKTGTRYGPKLSKRNPIDRIGALD